VTVPEPGGVTAVQLRATVPAPGVAEEIVGAGSVVALPDAVPAPVELK
jgi:hypothetical protein